MQLDLRQRALIRIGDFSASEEKIQEVMKEIEKEDLPAKRRGRKPTMKGGRTISVWVDDETKRLLGNVAARNGCSVSEVIRRFIKIWLVDHKDGEMVVQNETGKKPEKSLQ